MVNQTTTETWRNLKPHPVILLGGSIEFFADRAVRNVRDAMRKKIDELETVYVECADYQAGQIFDLASPGLFGETKLVVFTGAERCTDEFIADTIKYLEQPSDESVVIIRHSLKSTRGKRMLDSVRASQVAIEVSCADFEKDFQRIAFIEQEFSPHKVQKAAVQAIADIFGKNYEEIAAAVSQVVVDVEGEITFDVIEKYFGGRVEITNFKIADAAISGQRAEALVLLRQALSQGAEPVLVLSALASKIEEVAKIHGDPKATAASIGKTDYIFKKIRDLSGTITEDGLATMLSSLADTDAAIKGAEASPHFALERMVQLMANKGKI